MKKLVFAALAVVPMVASAVVTTVAAPTSTTDSTVRVICDGTTATKVAVYGGGGAVVATPVFVRSGFVAQCSANTFVKFKEVSSTLVVVASGSAKGNQTYNGSTNGGAIVASAKCTGTNDACTDANVTTALTAAETAASSN